MAEAKNSCSLRETETATLLPFVPDGVSHSILVSDKRVAETIWVSKRQKNVEPTSKITSVATTVIVLPPDEGPAGGEKVMVPVRSGE